MKLLRLLLFLSVAIGLQAQSSHVFVDTTTPQTITGQKTYNNIRLGSGTPGGCVYADSNLQLQVSASGCASVAIPVGGTTGQALIKNSNTNYDTIWGSPVGSVPVGGAVGQVLTKNSATNYDYSWSANVMGSYTTATMPQNLPNGTFSRATDGMYGLWWTNQNYNRPFLSHKNIQDFGARGDGGWYPSVGCTSGSGTFTSVAALQGRLPKVGDYFVAANCGAASADFSCTISGGTATTGTAYGTVICASGTASVTGSHGGRWGPVSGVDDTTAFNNAMTYCTNGTLNGGCVIDIPDGVYFISNITTPVASAQHYGRVVLQGLGSPSTSNIVGIGANQTNIITAPANSNAVTVQGLTFYSYDYTNKVQTAIGVQGGTNHNFEQNSFYNVYDGIQMYNTWEDHIGRNRFYGPTNAAVHFGPPGLGPVNATVVENNIFDWYGKYAIWAESSGGGGSYGNTYKANLLEGSSLTTLADVSINGGGNIWESGYTELPGNAVSEVSYTQFENKGYGNYKFTFPLCIRDIGGGSTWTAQTGGSSYAGSTSCAPDTMVTNPTITRVAAGGTFAAGLDVYIKVTYKDTVNVKETNPTSTVNKITNTVLNDAVQVTPANWTDSTGNYTQYCVYEADVATGAAAPAQNLYKQAACTAKGTATTVTSTATGTALKPGNWSVDQRGNYSTWNSGWAPSANSSTAYASGVGWQPSGTQYFTGSSTVSAGLVTWPYVIGGQYDFPYSRVDIAGTYMSRSNGANTNPNYPTQMGTNALVPNGMYFWNNYLYYAPANPLSENAYFVCVNTGGCATNPIVPTQWKKGGYVYTNEHAEIGNYPPVITTVTGDQYMLTGGFTSWQGLMGWIVTTGGASGGTYYPYGTVGSLGLQNRTVATTMTFDPSGSGGGSSQGDAYRVGGNHFKVTLNQNVTSSIFQNGLNGSLYVFEICQNSTGGYTFAWPTQFKGAGTPSLTANTCSVQEFSYDGTNAYAITQMNTSGATNTPGSITAGTSVNATTRVTSALNTMAFSATPTFDASTANNFKMTLTGNVTLSAWSNLVTGQHISMQLCQDATGGRTFVWPTNTAGQGTIGNMPNICYSQAFSYDGTNVNAIGTMVASNNFSNSGSTPFYCGTTVTCGNTQVHNARTFYGTVTLAAGTATVTGLTPAYTSTTSYVCTGTDTNGTGASAVNIVIVSASSFTVNGTGTDVVNYQCIGN